MCVYFQQRTHNQNIEGITNQKEKDSQPNREMGKILKQALFKRGFLSGQSTEIKIIMRRSPEWLKLIKQVIPSVAKTEHLELSYSASGNAQSLQRST